MVGTVAGSSSPFDLCRGLPLTFTCGWYEIIPSCLQTPSDCSNSLCASILTGLNRLISKDYVQIAMSMENKRFLVVGVGQFVWFVEISFLYPISSSNFLKQASSHNGSISVTVYNSLG